MSRGERMVHIMYAKFMYDFGMGSCLNSVKNVMIVHSKMC